MEPYARETLLRLRDFFLMDGQRLRFFFRDAKGELPWYDIVVALDDVLYREIRPTATTTPTCSVAADDIAGLDIFVRDRVYEVLHDRLARTNFMQGRK